MIDHNPYSPPQTVSPRTPEPVDWLWVWNGNTIHILCFVLGISLGFLSRFLRPFIMGNIHFEALIELGLKIAMSIAILWLASKIRTHRPVLRFTLPVLALWVGSAVGWSVMNGSTWTDHLLVNANCCLITLVLGVTLIWGIARGRRQ